VVFLKITGGTEWYHTFGLTADMLHLEEREGNPHWSGKAHAKPLLRKEELR
jgi:hypothetical protein